VKVLAVFGKFLRRLSFLLD